MPTAHMKIESSGLDYRQKMERSRNGLLLCSVRTLQTKFRPLPDSDNEVTWVQQCASGMTAIRT